MSQSPEYSSENSEQVQGGTEAGSTPEVPESVRVISDEQLQQYGDGAISEIQQATSVLTTEVSVPKALSSELQSDLNELTVIDGEVEMASSAATSEIIAVLHGGSSATEKANSITKQQEIRQFSKRHHSEERSRLAQVLVQERAERFV